MAVTCAHWDHLSVDTVMTMAEGVDQVLIARFVSGIMWRMAR